METLDFSCSSRKREEVDGKALAGDKTVLSSLFLLFFFVFLLTFLDRVVFFSIPPPPRRMYVPLSPLLPRSAAHFCSRIQILCEEVRSTFESAATDRAAGRNVDGVSKRV